MKKRNTLLLGTLLLAPTMVMAATYEPDSMLPFAIIWEIFCTIHMSVFFLLPLSYLISKEEDVKKTFLKLFIVRVCILVIFDLFITPYIFIFDFILIFVGAFLILPLASIILGKKSSVPKTKFTISFNDANSTGEDGELKCAKCGGTLDISDNYCRACGAFVEGNKIDDVIVPNKEGIVLKYTDFDELYKQDEEEVLEEFISRELVKANIEEETNLIPKDVLRKKKVMIIIFSLFLMFFISSIFFHFPTLTYIVFMVITFIMYKLVNKYDFIKYLKKEIKSRPSEKMSNIIMSIKETCVPDDSKVSFFGCLIVSVIIPMILFFSPRIMYEESNGGYYVRFYTFGINNYKTATIPDTYKGKPVLGLRGNTFSNIYFLESVTLPDTIKEIRGQAFKNDKRLKEVKLPSELEYLGGGAFYNCTSLTNIVLPDTLSFMGGETFKNAKSLKSVKLSSRLTEIRGNTFENCSSLSKIDIPDTVTRIGGHAFHGCKSLISVTFTENSKLKEIGSSAFRECTALLSITLPKNVSINERAFKESPTSIKRFGDFDISKLIDESKFTNKTSAYLKMSNDTYFLKPFNAEIILMQKERQGNLNIYTLKYKNESVSENFILSADKPYKKLSENLILYVDDSYFYSSYYSGLNLNIYYYN